MKINFKIVTGFIIFIVGFFLVSDALVVSAFESDLVMDQYNQEDAFRQASGFSQSTTIGEVVQMAIEGFLGLLAVIFVILMILAGYNWMTAGGDEQKVTKAKDTIRAAIIGLIIIVAAYAITFFVFKYMPYGAGTGGPG